MVKYISSIPLDMFNQIFILFANYQQNQALY